MITRLSEGHVMSYDVAVIGAGNMGIAVFANLIKAGKKCLIIDVDPKKVQALIERRPTINEAEVEAVLKNYAYDVSDDVADAVNANVGYVAVPTPSSPGGNCDYSYVIDVMKKLSHFPLVIGSTIYPGGSQILDKYHSDYVLHPVFLRAGNGVHDYESPGKVVFGIRTNEPPDYLRPFLDVINCGYIHYVGLREAEWIKAVHNTFLCMKVAFSNEIARACNVFKINPFEVINAVFNEDSNGRILAFSHLNPGPPYSGTCFPKDMKILRAIVREQHERMLPCLINAIDQSNMLQLGKIYDFIGRHGAPIGIVGLSHRPGTDELRGAFTVNILKNGEHLAFDPVISALSDGEYEEMARGDTTIIGIKSKVVGSIHELCHRAKAIIVNMPLDIDTLYPVSISKKPVLDLYHNQLEMIS